MLSINGKQNWAERNSCFWDLISEKCKSKFSLLNVSGGKVLLVSCTGKMWKVNDAKSNPGSFFAWNEVNNLTGWFRPIWGRGRPVLEAPADHPPSHVTDTVSLKSKNWRGQELKILPLINLQCPVVISNKYIPCKNTLSLVFGIHKPVYFSPPPTTHLQYRFGNFLGIFVCSFWPGIWNNQTPLMKTNYLYFKHTQYDCFLH